MMQANSQNHSSTQAREISEIALKCVGARLRALNRMVTRIYDDKLRNFNLRFSQLNILVVVASNGPLTAMEISRLLGFEKSTLSRNLKVLCAEGWLSREPNNAYTATKSGVELIASAKPAWQQAQSEVESLLGSETVIGIRKSFSRISYTDG